MGSVLRQWVSGSVTVNSVQGEEESCMEEEAFELGFETGGKNSLGKQQGQKWERKTLEKPGDAIQCDCIFRVY